MSKKQLILFHIYELSKAEMEKTFNVGLRMFQNAVHLYDTVVGETHFDCLASCILIFPLSNSKNQ